MKAGADGVRHLAVLPTEDPAEVFSCNRRLRSQVLGNSYDSQQHMRNHSLQRQHAPAPRLGCRERTFFVRLESCQESRWIRTRPKNRGSEMELFLSPGCDQD